MASPKRTQKKSGLKVIFKKVLFAQILSFITIIIGAILIFISSASLLNLDFKHPFLSKPEPEIVSVRPIRLYIPNLAKSLAIEVGEVVNNRWSISQTGVSFYKDSAIPGSNGNSVIYGHNLKNILGDLPKLTSEDKIYVILSDGSFARYAVFNKKSISPNQVEILNQTQDSRLTIYTCSGFLDTARFAVIAKLVNST